MWNMIVIHYVNEKVVARFDFGEDLDKAIDFIHDIMEEAYQIGKHRYEVINEVNKARYYKQEFEIVA